MLDLPVLRRTAVRPARGTTGLCKLFISKHFTKSCFLCPQNLDTFGHLFLSDQRTKETDKCSNYFIPSIRSYS